MDVVVRYMPSEGAPGGSILKHSTELRAGKETLQAGFVKTEQVDKWAFVVKRWEAWKDECGNKKTGWKTVYTDFTRSAKNYDEYIAKLAETIAYIAVDGVTYWSNPTIDECLRKIEEGLAEPVDDCIPAAEVEW